MVEPLNPRTRVTVGFLFGLALVSFWSCHRCSGSAEERVVGPTPISLPETPSGKKNPTPQQIQHPAENPNSGGSMRHMSDRQSSPPMTSTPSVSNPVTRPEAHVVVLEEPQVAAKSETGHWRIGVRTGVYEKTLRLVEAGLTSQASQALQNWNPFFEFGSRTTQVQNVLDGYYLRVEGGRRLLGTVGLGGRLTWIRPRTIEVRQSFSGVSGEFLDGIWRMEASIASLGLGVWLEGEEPSGFHYEFSVYVGPLAAWLRYTEKRRSLAPLTGLDETVDFSLPLGRWALSMETAANLGFVLKGRYYLFLEAGHRWAGLGWVKNRATLDANGDGRADYVTGEAFGFPGSTDPQAVDLGGVFVGSGLLVLF